MGHEYAGIVEEVGAEVATIKPGQFVVGSFWASDNTCEICRTGYQSACVTASRCCPTLPDRDSRSPRARSRGKRGKEALEAIAAAHAELRHERGQLIGRLQSSGACDDPESGEIVREGYGKLVAFVERVSGLPPDQVAAFLGRSLLIDLITALDLDHRPEPWSERIFAAIKG